MMSGHAAFVATAYFVSALTLFGLIAGILIDQRARRREIGELEAAGVSRRAARKGKAVK